MVFDRNKCFLLIFIAFGSFMISSCNQHNIDTTNNNYDDGSIFIKDAKIGEHKIYINMPINDIYTVIQQNNYYVFNKRETEQFISIDLKNDNIPHLDLIMLYFSKNKKILFRAQFDYFFSEGGKITGPFQLQLAKDNFENTLIEYKKLYGNPRQGVLDSADARYFWIVNDVRISISLMKMFAFHSYELQKSGDINDR